MVAFLQGLFLLAIVPCLVVSVDAVFKRDHEIIFSFLQEIKGDVKDRSRSRLLVMPPIYHCSPLRLATMAYSPGFGFESDGFVPMFGVLG